MINQNSPGVIMARDYLAEARASSARIQAAFGNSLSGEDSILPSSTITKLLELDVEATKADISDECKQFLSSAIVNFLDRHTSPCIFD